MVQPSRKLRNKKRTEQRQEYLKNISAPMRTVFNISDIANIIYSFLNFYEKISFMSVSHQCKRWTKKRILNDKLCDDLEEAIFVRKKKSFIYKILNIGLELLSTDKFTSDISDCELENFISDLKNIFNLNDCCHGIIKLSSNILITDLLIVNNCYKILENFYRRQTVIYRNNHCAIYKIMYKFCYVTLDKFKDPKNNAATDTSINNILSQSIESSDRAITFIHNILKLNPCTNFQCKDCSNVVECIVTNNFTVCDKFYYNNLEGLLILAVKNGSDITFKSIYNKIKDFTPAIDLHIRLNTLLMLACKYINNNNNNHIINFCIDQGANPYIMIKYENLSGLTKFQSSFGLIDKKYFSARIKDNLDEVQKLDLIRNYIICVAKKYSNVDSVQNSLIRNLKYIKKYYESDTKYFSESEPDLNLMFYLDYIELSNVFIAKFVKNNILACSDFYSQYMELNKKIFELKFKDTSMSNYFEYLNNILKLDTDQEFVSNGEIIESIIKMNTFDLKKCRWPKN